MEADLVKHLLELNRSFYARFASEFSETRSGERLNLTFLARYLNGVERLLDAGCGNGRLAVSLNRAGYELGYLGLDVTLELVRLARANAAQLAHVRAEFAVADLTQAGWEAPFVHESPFDAACALAVLHHVPGEALRRRVLTGIARLLVPNGVLILTNWQFTTIPRLSRKRVAWETLGIEPRALDPGDYLLDWKRGGEGLRYCHEFTREEIEALAAACGFRVLEQFLGDENMNLYSVLQRTR